MFTSTLKVSDNSGSVTWISPSNIALIKYWGKYAEQLPSNPSISFTLKNAYTKTSVKYSPKTAAKNQVNFTFEGKENEKFLVKIEKYIERLKEYMPYLSEFDLEIESQNTFPHSSGIASSASSMSALALCLVSVENDVCKLDLNQDDFLKRVSFFARLGSGSACRSVYKNLAIWGDYSSSSSLEYATPFNDVDSIFNDYQDAIAIVSKGEKAVSSSAGHKLMESHPFAKVRFENARNNLVQLISAMQAGDIDRFIEITEAEALELHGLMMNSSPSYILMRPNTLAIIERIRNFRKESGVKVSFTLDAGPNVHILYPKSSCARVKEFLSSEVAPLCEASQIIFDEVGPGPTRV